MTKHMCNDDLFMLFIIIYGLQIMENQSLRGGPHKILSWRRAVLDESVEISFNIFDNIPNRVARLVPHTGQ